MAAGVSIQRCVARDSRDPRGSLGFFLGFCATPPAHCDGARAQTAPRCPDSRRARHGVLRANQTTRAPLTLWKETRSCWRRRHTCFPQHVPAAQAPRRVCGCVSAQRFATKRPNFAPPQHEMRMLLTRQRLCPRRTRANQPTPRAARAGRARVVQLHNTDEGLLSVAAELASSKGGMEREGRESSLGRLQCCARAFARAGSGCGIMANTHGPARPGTARMHGHVRSCPW